MDHSENMKEASYFQKLDDKADPALKISIEQYNEDELKRVMKQSLVNSEYENELLFAMKQSSDYEQVDSDLNHLNEVTGKVLEFINQTLSPNLLVCKREQVSALGHCGVKSISNSIGVTDNQLIVHLIALLEKEKLNLGGKVCPEVIDSLHKRLVYTYEQNEYEGSLDSKYHLDSLMDIYVISLLLKKNFLVIQDQNDGVVLVFNFNLGKVRMWKMEKGDINMNSFNTDPELEGLLRGNYLCEDKLTLSNCINTMPYMLHWCYKTFHFNYWHICKIGK